MSKLFFVRSLSVAVLAAVFLGHRFRMRIAPTGIAYDVTIDLAPRFFRQLFTHQSPEQLAVDRWGGALVFKTRLGQANVLPKRGHRRLVVLVAVKLRRSVHDIFT